MGTVVKNKRIIGNALTLKLANTDFWSDFAEYSLEPTSSDKDTLTFADAASGVTSKWVLKGKAIQSTAPASLWSKVWEASGTTVDFTLAPHGNDTPSAQQPHFTGKVKIGPKPPIGTAAGEEKGATFDFEWEVEGEPTKKTTA